MSQCIYINKKQHQTQWNCTLCPFLPLFPRYCDREQVRHAFPFPRVAFILKNNSKCVFLVLSALTFAFSQTCVPLESSSSTWRTGRSSPENAREDNHPHYAPASTNKHKCGESTFFRRLMLWVECAGRRVMQWSSSLRIDALPPNGNNRKALKCTVKMLSLASHWRANV